MLKIGVVVSALENRGPVNVIRSQFSHMGAGENFTVFCLTHNIDKKIIEEFISYGVTVVILEGANIIVKAQCLRRHLNEKNINILHSHGTPADLCSAFTFSKVKKITTVHNCLLSDFLPLFGFFKGMLIFILQMLSFMFISNKIACSKSVGNVLDGWRVKNKVILNGVNHSLYKPASDDEVVKIKEKYSINNLGCIYLYCGSFIKRKNVDFLLKNIKLNEEDVFILVGEGDLLSECEKIVAHDPRYIFLGQLDSCLSLYKIADYFVSASLSEGLPLAVLEAYSCGAKLILSDIPSHREIYELVLNDSVVLFSLSKPEELSQVALRCDLNAQSAHDSFSAKEMAKKYNDFYLCL